MYLKSQRNGDVESNFALVESMQDKILFSSLPLEPRVCK